MSPAFRLLICVGGLALLAATAIDTFAVIGRHIGLSLPGSIELMQTVVLLSGAISMLVATVENSNARVRLLVDRLPPRFRKFADRLSDALTFLFFAALLGGSSWIAWDLRHANEQSELLGIPWMVLRIVLGLTLLATVSLLLRRIFGRKPRRIANKAEAGGE